MIFILLEMGKHYIQPKKSGVDQTKTNRKNSLFGAYAECFKLIMSFLVPFTKKFKSELNPTLEINYINGKKRLDSPHANYSYGTLQKVLDFGLKRITLKDHPEILILGLGGGSVVESIEEKFHFEPKEIIGVEFDPVVIQLTIDEFKLDRYKELKIVEGDAFNYVRNCDHHFDLIIVDIFIDDIVPEPFYSIGFWKNIANLLNFCGSVIFNAGMNLEKGDKIDRIMYELSQQIDFSKYENVEEFNTELIGRKVQFDS